MAGVTATVIDEQDLEQFDTLDKSDLGKSAVIANGCFHIRDSHEQAHEFAKILNG